MSHRHSIPKENSLKDSKDFTVE